MDIRYIALFISTIDIVDNTLQFNLKFDDTACCCYYYNITTKDKILEGEIVPNGSEFIFSEDRLMELENLKLEICEKKGRKVSASINFIIQ